MFHTINCFASVNIDEYFVSLLEITALENSKGVAHSCDENIKNGGW